MDIDTTRLQSILSSLSRISGHSVDPAFTDSSDFFNQLEHQIDLIEQHKLHESKLKKAFTDHLENCILNNFFAKLPVSYENEEIGLMSYVFNTYLEELESQIIMRDNFEFIFNSIAYQVIVIDEYNAIRFMNHAAKLFYLQKKQSEIEYFDEIDSPEFVERIYQFKRSELNEEAFEYTWKSLSDTKKFINFKLMRINFEGKSQVLILGEDITQAKLEEAKITRATLHGQDLERKRIAKDLHDSLGQQLSAAKMHIHFAIQDKNQVERDRIFASALDMITHSVESIREICFDLTPAYLDDTTLIHLVERMVGKLRGVGPEFIVSVNTQPIPFSNKKDELFVYRIIQEFINNSMKHAQASLIYIFFKYVKKTGLLHIKMVDDGVGFDMNHVVFNNGIYNIKQRLQALDSVFEFKSTPNKGTELSFIVDIKVKKNK